MDEGILVEDTSLDIEGAKIGINIRWLLEHLKNYVDKRAQWRTLLAYRRNDLVHIFEGKVSGTIVQRRGAGGFGFDPFFLPEGFKMTLAEAKPDTLYARAKAVEALLRGVPFISRPCISQWSGLWQEKEGKG